jgi:hypothetical protein
MFRLTLAMGLPLLALSCAPVEADQDFITDGPPVRVVGKPESCVSITRIRSSKVRDDRTIDFEMSGGKVYRNTLSSGCPRLGFEEAFTYETSLTRLCNTDIIYVLEQVGGQPRRGAGCGLGDFVPVEYIKDEAK